jgi:hypothetical protein
MDKDDIGNVKGKYVISTYTPISNDRNISEEITITTADGYDSYTKAINYDHIPAINFLSKAKTNLVKLDIKIVGKNIGYIIGAGDKVPQALEAMGYTVRIISEADLTENNLKQFDAIVTGVRAYNVHEWLNNSYDVLMNYVKNGGVLLVQYNTSSNIGPIKAKIAPFAFDISRIRVSEEDATVNFTQPTHQLLNFPNKITEKDFEGWVQERSIYHAENLDSNYQTIFSMKDTGEKEHNGSLIVGNFGKGKFIYTGISFFRQLPAGVPGAYRLMANLIAKKPL